MRISTLAGGCKRHAQQHFGCSWCAQAHRERLVHVIVARCQVTKQNRVLRPVHKVLTQPLPRQSALQLAQAAQLLGLAEYLGRAHRAQSECTTAPTPPSDAPRAARTESRAQQSLGKVVWSYKRSYKNRQPAIVT